jgi:hypothetical protein
VQLLIPPATLKPGNYAVVVRGLATPASAASSGSEIARYPFTLAFAK